MQCLDYYDIFFIFLNGFNCTLQASLWLYGLYYVCHWRCCTVYKAFWGEGRFSVLGCHYLASLLIQSCCRCGFKKYSSRHSCNTAHSMSIWPTLSVWPQWWQAVGGPRDKKWHLVALVWPIWSCMITTSWPLVKCWNFFWLPQSRFHEAEISAMYSYSPLGLN